MQCKEEEDVDPKLLKKANESSWNQNRSLWSLVFNRRFLKELLVNVSFVLCMDLIDGIPWPTDLNKTKSMVIFSLFCLIVCTPDLVFYSTLAKD